MSKRVREIDTFGIDSLDIQQSHHKKLEIITDDKLRNVRYGLPQRPLNRNVENKFYIYSCITSANNNANICVM